MPETAELYNFGKIEKESRRILPDTGCLVIRLDGKDVTKNKARFDLCEKDGFTKTIFTTAKETALLFAPPTAAPLHHGISFLENEGFLVFAIMDEVSIVFLSPAFFFAHFQDNNQIYDAGIFLQSFLARFWVFPQYYGVMFGVSAFLIPKEAGEDYIRYRRDLCGKAAQDYLEKRAGQYPQGTLPGFPEYFDGWYEKTAPMGQGAACGGYPIG